MLPRLGLAARHGFRFERYDACAAGEAEGVGGVGLLSRDDPAARPLIAAVYANRLARGPSVTIELTKQAVYHAMGVSLETHAEYEENLLNKVHHTEDVKEGRLAFREKRQPQFKGR